MPMFSSQELTPLCGPEVWVWGHCLLPRDPLVAAPRPGYEFPKGTEGLTCSKCLLGWKCARWTLFEYLMSLLIHKINKGDLCASGCELLLALCRVPGPGAGNAQNLTGDTGTGRGGADDFAPGSEWT